MSELDLEKKLPTGELIATPLSDRETILELIKERNSALAEVERLRDIVARCHCAALETENLLLDAEVERLQALVQELVAACELAVARYRPCATYWPPECDLCGDDCREVEKTRKERVLAAIAEAKEAIGE